MGKLNWLVMLLLVGMVFSLINCTELETLDNIEAIKDTTSIGGSKNDTTYKDTTSVPKDTVIIVPGDTSKVIIDTTLVPPPAKDTVKTVPIDSLIKKDTTVVITDPVVVTPPVTDTAVTPETYPSINLIFDGDSQTKRGHYPAKTIELLKAKGYKNIITTNFAVAGQNTLAMITDGSAQVAPSFNSKYKKNIVCYWIGANDAIRDAKTDTAKLYQNLLSYYTSLKKAGFIVVMINLPDANHHVGTNVVNAMFARNYSKISDVYVNCRQTGGAFENNKNTEYYTTDGIHLNVYGYQYLAQKYVYPKLVAFLSK